MNNKRHFIMGFLESVLKSPFLEDSCEAFGYQAIGCGNKKIHQEALRISEKICSKKYEKALFKFEDFTKNLNFTNT